MVNLFRKSVVSVFITLLGVAMPFLSLFAQQAIKVLPGNPNIQYDGRITVKDTVASIYWPGSSVRILFQGTSVRIIMKDQGGGNYYSVVLDGDSNFVIKPDTSYGSYLLYSGSADKQHEIQVFRRNGYSSGATWFYGFECAPATIISPVPVRKRSIEFYGNSITVGSGMYPDSARYGSENNFNSYAALTARHFQAAYSCIARSGIGMMVSWFPMIMSQLYYRENPFDSASNWNFSRNIPDIVVINLLQNDCALFQESDHPEFRKRFGANMPSEEFIENAYRHFVTTIRKKYPSAHIICALGSMDAVKTGSPWPGYISKAVASIGDPKIYTHFFRFINTPDHPTEKEHAEMAASLIAFIDQKIQW